MKQIARLSIFFLLLSPGARSQTISYQADSRTQGITSLRVGTDTMNWVIKTDGTQYQWVTDRYQWGRSFGLPQGVTMKVSRSKVQADVVETYTFTNTTKKALTLERAGIYTPFNDNYPSAKTCMTSRCNAHIWAGGTGAYVQAVRMDGQGAGLGLVVTRGSIDRYEVFERSREKGMSNYRGVLALGLPRVRLAPGKAYTLQWRLFAHHGSDFEQGVLQRGGTVVSSPKYVYEVGETAQVTFRTGQTTQTVSQPVTQPGHLRVSHGGAWAELLGISSADSLLGRRARFIVDHQQMNNPASTSFGAYMVYDNLADTIVWDSHGRSDLSDGRERVGMGVFLAKYLRLHPDGYLQGSLLRYADFVRTRLQRADYTTLSASSGKFNNRGYNYTWVADLFFRMYELTGKRQYAVDGYRTMKRLYSSFGHGFYCIDIPVTVSLRVLGQAGLTAERDSLLDDYRKTADTFLANGLNYPPFEVNYEQSIVAPSVQFLCELYLATRDDRYLRGAEVQLPALEAFAGRQPSYHLNEIAIRHWDGYWFGKRQLFGDVMPHYWSAISAAAYHYYAQCTGKELYQRRAEEIVRNNLCNFFEDGKASCAYVYPDGVNGERAAYYDDYANDQDWALAFYLLVMQGI